MKLWCPPLNVINSDPAEIDDYKPDRHLTQDTFFIVINFITSQESRFTKLEELEAIQDDEGNELFVIQHLSKYQLALLSYHILHLNKDHLDSELYRELKDRLEQKFLPPWKQTVIPIDNGLQDILLTKVQINVEQKTKKMIHKLITENMDKTQKEAKDEFLLALELNNWTINTIIEVFHLISENIKDLSDYRNEITDLVFQAENQLIDIMLSHESDWIKKASVSMILFIWNIEKGDEGINSAKEIIDSLWVEWNDHANDKISPFRFLLFACQSILIKNLFSTSIPFLSKRNLVHSMISKLEEDKEKFWNVLYLVFNQNPIHPWVMKFLMDGFQAYISSIFDYLQALPQCKERSKLTNHLESQLKEYMQLILNYLSANYRIIHPEEDATTFVNQIEGPAKLELFFDNLFNFIDTSVSVLLFIDKERTILHSSQIYLLDLWLKLIQKTEQKELMFLYELDMLILTNQFPFVPIFEIVKQEVVIHKTVMASSTFEDRIVKVITQAFEYLNKVEDDGQKVENRTYEILLVFATEWLQVFSKDRELFVETSSVLSAIIIICFSHLTRSYFQNKEINRSFLMYLNMYYFSEFINNNIYSLAPIGDDYSSIEAISSKFNSMVTEWNFNNSIGVEIFDNFANSVELTLKSSLSSNSTQSSMLEDDLLFSFLDMKDALDVFFNKEIQSFEEGEVNKIKEMEVYKPANANALTRLGRIGSSIEMENQLPFPLFRTIEQFAAAIELVPIKFSPDNFDENAIQSSIEKLWKR